MNEEVIDFKARMKTILWCLVAMCILGSIIIFIDPKLNQHMGCCFLSHIEDLLMLRWRMYMNNTMIQNNRGYCRNLFIPKQIYTYNKNVTQVL